MTQNLSDFDYLLPEGRIATRPLVPRSAAKLLVYQNEVISDKHVGDLVEFLNPGDVVIMNDTKVIPARLFGHRLRTRDGNTTRSKLEVTLLSAPDDGVSTAMIKPLRNIQAGEIIDFGNGCTASLVEKIDAHAKIKFDIIGPELDAWLLEFGHMPLPPYIASARAADDQDKSDYQTLWARHKGAVAAPTASLHFDQETLDRLAKTGVKTGFVTLHVGAGTFLPVKNEDISQHVMHSEWGDVSQEVVDLIAEAKANGKRVISLGTTALRILETASRGGVLKPFCGETDIFITPGFEFKTVDVLFTNFHLPKSTLLMLVSAFVGLENMRDIYAHAINHAYRFFSYGDASILFRSK